MLNPKDSCTRPSLAPSCVRKPVNRSGQ
jgi:hypothetical protein